MKGTGTVVITTLLPAVVSLAWTCPAKAQSPSPSPSVNQDRQALIEEMKRRGRALAAAAAQRERDEKEAGRQLRYKMQHLEEKAMYALITTQTINSDSEIFAKIHIGAGAGFVDFGHGYWYVPGEKRIKPFEPDLVHAAGIKIDGYVTGLNTKKLITNESFLAKIWEIGTRKSGDTRYRLFTADPDEAFRELSR
jgi:hypothetical protein